MEPIMEAIPTPGTITGSGIVDDLLGRVAERLGRHDCLRAADAYAGYSARVTVDLQLRDVDLTPVTSEVCVGSIDATRPAAHVTMAVSGAAPVVEALGDSLERPIDQSGVSGTPAPAPGKEKRWYPPRRQAPRV